ncbi:MAG: hypothetical protein BJ554DRAFT_4140 [Olpidium bornovanus]|uniref:Uncharacterized protein n=1 Tax=Olpidium bornovanus TaxID=278681 RepID=A0A8H7ZN57_9FUNG|nr:MAG: hypothetical protein BJ554DRAFT_4140 [Olpidium bornovanus]
MVRFAVLQASPLADVHVVASSYVAGCARIQLQESVLDYAFAKLGVDTHGVHHPVLITEPFCNPPAARRSMSELLFEGYAVPSVSYGVDSLFSYYQNGLSFDGGLIVAPGHTATHVVPIVGGKPDIEQCKR